MRYSKDHKDKTREKILKAAGNLFRKHGVNNTSIDKLMSSIGLTRGGFYAHFKSKGHLILEIMKQNNGLVKWLRDRNGTDKHELMDEALTSIQVYLNPKNRKIVGDSCNLSALAGDVGRGSKAMRYAYAKRLEIVIDEIMRSLPDSSDKDRRAILTAILVVGGQLLSRAVEPGEFSDLIEKISYEEVSDLLKK